METKEKQVVTIDEKEYEVEALSDTARYCLNQLQAIRQDAVAKRTEIDRLEMAIRGFNLVLREELDKIDEGAE